MSPVLHLLVTRPAWVAEHAEGYADLLAAELDDAAASVLRLALLAVLALIALGLGLGLGGMALISWAALPAAAQPQAAWLLWATPALPLVLGLGCLAALWRTGRLALFAVLRQQLQADLVLLRESGAA